MFSNRSSKVLFKHPTQEHLLSTLKLRKCTVCVDTKIRQRYPRCDVNQLCQKGPYCFPIVNCNNKFDDDVATVIITIWGF